MVLKGLNLVPFRFDPFVFFLVGVDHRLKLDGKSHRCM